MYRGQYLEDKVFDVFFWNIYIYKKRPVSTGWKTSLFLCQFSLLRFLDKILLVDIFDLRIMIKHRIKKKRFWAKFGIIIYIVISTTVKIK